MSGITLPSNIKGVLSKAKFRVVSEEVEEEIIKMTGRLSAGVDLFRIIIV